MGALVISSGVCLSPSLARVDVSLRSADPAPCTEVGQCPMHVHKKMKESVVLGEGAG